MGHVKDLERMKFDKRVVDFNLKRGIINKSDIQKYISSLPDLSGQATSIEIEPADKLSLDKPGAVHNSLQ